MHFHCLCCKHCDSVFCWHILGRIGSFLWMKQGTRRYQQNTILQGRVLSCETAEHYKLTRFQIRMPLATLAVRSSKCFEKLVPHILTYVCLRLGSCLHMILCHLIQRHSVWTAPKVPFSWLFVKIDGSPHCKSCWHLTPASWNCANMTSRTFVALLYIYVHVQFLQSWPCLKHPNVLERFSIENIIFFNELILVQVSLSSVHVQKTDLLTSLWLQEDSNPLCHLCNLFVSN